MRLDWTKIWEEFDDWFMRDRKKECKKCGHVDRRSPEWEDQQKAVQRIVTRHIARMTKKGSKK